MARTRYTAEEIICHLWTVEIEAGKGIGHPPQSVSAWTNLNCGLTTRGRSAAL